MCFCGTGLPCIPQSLICEQSWFLSSAGQKTQGAAWEGLNHPQAPTTRPDRTCLTSPEWALPPASSGLDHVSSLLWLPWRAIASVSVLLPDKEPWAADRAVNWASTLSCHPQAGLGMGSRWPSLVPQPKRELVWAICLLEETLLSLLLHSHLCGDMAGFWTTRSKEQAVLVTCNWVKGRVPWFSLLVSGQFWGYREMYMV